MRVVIQCRAVRRAGALIWKMVEKESEDSESERILLTPKHLKSAVCHFFGFWSVNGEIIDKTNVVCKLCKKPLLFHSTTSNMRTHMQRAIALLSFVIALQKASLNNRSVALTTDGWTSTSEWVLMEMVRISVIFVLLWYCIIDYTDISNSFLV